MPLTTSLPGTRVRTWDGYLATIVGGRHGWLTVQIDGESTVHDYQLSQIEAVS